MSEVAWRALERTARAMGAREGTEPEDDPLMRSHSAQVRAEGHANGHREGHANGHREGHAEGHREGRAEGHRVGRAEGHREGRAEGHREGRAEGHREGVAQGHMNAVAQILDARGIAVALDAAEDREIVGGVSGDTLIAAALACTDEDDFRRRVGEHRARRAGRGPGAPRGGTTP